MANIGFRKSVVKELIKDFKCNFTNKISVLSRNFSAFRWARPFDSPSCHCRGHWRFYCSVRTELEWREAVSEAEQLVGFPMSYVNMRWLFNDEIANAATHLRQLIRTDNRCLKPVKNLLIGSKSNLQSVGLIVLLVSKAAGFNPREFTEDQYDSGLLHSQRALAEIVEMKRNGHIIHRANVQASERLGNKFKDLLCGNKIVMLSGDYLFAKCLQHMGGIRDSCVNELISSGLRDMIDGDHLGEYSPEYGPLPARPKGDCVFPPFDWEHQDNLCKLGGHEYLGTGKDEWVLRTMLRSGSMLGKGCQGAMMLAHRGEQMERDAYSLGGHLALLWQLYLDVKDFFIHPQSYSLVSAPVIMALWEYPTLYGHILESKLEGKPVEFKQLYYAVRSTRAMEYVTGMAAAELAAILRCSERLPGGEARAALHKMARSIHQETLQYIE